MLLDITLQITREMIGGVPEHANQALAGHVGTHFDVMDEEFPLAYTRREGVVFDVSAIRGRDVEIADIAIDRVKRDSFVAFYTGFIEEIPYGAPGYFATHPQLSPELVDALLDLGVSVIGIDAGGIRRGKEHVPIDRLCAQRGTFVVENLCNLKALLPHEAFIVHTYPMNFKGVTGIPCRVIAEPIA